MDLQKIARRWQRKWKASRAFEADADERPKFFLTIPYPYPNGYPHVGHTYTFLRGDAFARYKRMRGFNVLFPQGWHATGSPIYAAARRVQEGEEKQIHALKLMGFTDEDIPQFTEPKNWIKVFSKAFERDFSDLGMSIDWRRSFITTDLNPRYSKFIQWQFRTLKKKDLVVKGSHPVVWSKKLGLPVGDHDRAEGEGEMPVEMTLLRFDVDGHVFPAATFRPETVFGVTNVWVNPDLVYVEAKVDGESWILVKDAVEKLEFQKRKVEIVREFAGQELVGKQCKNPVTGETVPILPALFVSADTGTAVVMSVPAHAPFDYVALQDIQSSPENYGIDAALVKDLEPVGLIEVEGYGKWPAKDVVEKADIESQEDRGRLDAATQEVYRKEFHTGKLTKRTGKYAGLSIEDAKDALIADFKKQQQASSMWELMNPVVSRALDRCVVKIVDNQWFMRYSDDEWKQQTLKCLQEVKLYPEKVRGQFEYVIPWLRDWACTREYGLGTKLPWDTQWVIESLSDSTIYMAFYTITHQLKQVTLGNIDDRLFDYLLLGEGDPKNISVDAKLLNSMRREFTYWYPVDFRNSGKDLVQNHLAFFLFNHVAIFPEKYWPRSIGVNGYVNIQKQKMSKSKGIFKTLRQVIDDFSADPVRITILSSGEELNDVDWDPDTARTLKNRLETWYEFVLKYYSRGQEGTMRSVDRWMQHVLHNAIETTTAAMDETLFRSALMNAFFDLHRHTKWYMRRTANKPNPRVISEVIDAQIRMLAPFAPHICEELWAKLGMEGFISFAEWPEFDENMINPAVEQGEQMMVQILDDVVQVKKLANIDKPRKLMLFVAEEWKRSVCDKVRELLPQTRNIGEIMKSVLADVPDRQKEASALVQKFVKDPSKIPTAAMNADTEQACLEDAREFLENEVGCSVQIIPESKSDEKKAKLALPGKPAIVLE